MDWLWPEVGTPTKARRALDRASFLSLFACVIFLIAAIDNDMAARTSWIFGVWIGLTYLLYRGSWVVGILLAMLLAPMVSAAVHSQNQALCALAVLGFVILSNGVRAARAFRLWPGEKLDELSPDAIGIRFLQWLFPGVQSETSRARAAYRAALLMQLLGAVMAMQRPGIVDAFLVGGAFTLVAYLVQKRNQFATMISLLAAFSFTLAVVSRPGPDGIKCIAGLLLLFFLNAARAAFFEHPTHKPSRLVSMEKARERTSEPAKIPVLSRIERKG